MSMHAQCPSCRSVNVQAADREQGLRLEPTTMGCNACGALWVHGFPPLKAGGAVPASELRALRFRFRASPPGDVVEARDVGERYRVLHEKVHGPVSAEERRR